MKTYPPEMPAVAIVAESLGLNEDQVWKLVDQGVIEIVDTRWDEPPSSVQLPLDPPPAFRDR